MSVLSFVLWPIRAAGNLFLRLILVCCRKRCGALWVVDLTCDEQGAKFYDQIERALSYIRERDPRRLTSIEKHVSYITRSSAIGSGGLYLNANNMCLVNYSTYYANAVGMGELDDEAQHVLTMTLASTIVHEATHARIDDAGVRYDRSKRQRIERCCRRQESQFMRRAAGDFKDVYGELVDWQKYFNFEHIHEFYVEYWSKSKWSHLREAWNELIGKHKPSTTISWKEYHRNCWEYAEAYQPWTLSMLYTRGAYHMWANNHSHAIADFRSILERNPDHEKARSCLGTSLMQASRHEEAIEVWLEAHERTQSNAVRPIAHILWRLDRTEEALQWLDRCVVDDAESDAVSDVDGSGTDESDFLFMRALILTDLGRHTEALEHLDRALKDHIIELGSNEYSFLALRAELVRELGDREGFEAARRELHSIDNLWRESCELEPVATKAYVLRVREEIHEPGLMTFVACLLICPDNPCWTRRTNYLKRIAANLHARANSDSDEYEDIYLRSLLACNDGYPWREVPEHLADERPVWVVDVNLDRIFLPEGKLTDDYVDCWVVQDGDTRKAWLRDEGREASDDSGIDTEFLTTPEALPC